MFANRRKDAGRLVMEEGDPGHGAKNFFIRGKVIRMFCVLSVTHPSQNFGDQLEGIDGSICCPPSKEGLMNVVA